MIEIAFLPGIQHGGGFLRVEAGIDQGFFETVQGHFLLYFPIEDVMLSFWDATPPV